MRIDNPTFSPGGLNTVTTSSLAVTASNAVTASFASTAYKRYVTVYRTTQQAINSSNTDISWEASTSTPDITVSGASITLPAGIYQVNANFVPNTYSDASFGQLLIKLVDSSNNVFSTVSTANPALLNANLSVATTTSMTGVIVLTSATTVKARVTTAVGSAQIGTAGTNLTIVQI